MAVRSLRITAIIKLRQPAWALLSSNFPTFTGESLSQPKSQGESETVRSLARAHNYLLGTRCSSRTVAGWSEAKMLILELIRRRIVEATVASARLYNEEIIGHGTVCGYHQNCLGRWLLDHRFPSPRFLLSPHCWHNTQIQKGWKAAITTDGCTFG